MSRPVLPRTSYADLSLEQAEAIQVALAPYLTPARNVRLDAALGARTRRLVVLLEDVFDEHNSSAVLRTAEAFGVLEVHYAPRAHNFQLSKRVSKGTHKWIDLIHQPSVAEAVSGFHARGYRCFGAALRGDTIPLAEVPIDRPVVMVLGNGHAGLTEEAQRAVDRTFAIPMTGFVESLNLSVASGIAMYELLGRMRQSGAEMGLDPLDRARVRATWCALSVKAAPELLARAGLPMPAMSRQPLAFVEKRFAERAGLPPPEEVGP